MLPVGSLAQLVEQRTFNPLVAGSSPARPTTNLQDQMKALRVIVTPFLLAVFALVAIPRKCHQPALEAAVPVGMLSLYI